MPGLSCALEPAQGPGWCLSVCQGHKAHPLPMCQHTQILCKDQETHSYTGMLHGMMPDHDTLACGRKITINLAGIKLDQIDIDAATMCIQCNTVIRRDALLKPQIDEMM